MMFFPVFFFFKQKTAYEMRISDWSSDVCSSDLLRRAIAAAAVISPASATSRPSDVSSAASSLPPFLRNFLGILTPATCFGSRALLFLPIPASFRSTTRYYKMAYYLYITPRRSEEHTSELQSLMRSSYAVFCLKKKNKEPRILYSY